MHFETVVVRLDRQEEVSWYVTTIRDEFSRVVLMLSFLLLCVGRASVSYGTCPPVSEGK